MLRVNRLGTLVFASVVILAAQQNVFADVIPPVSTDAGVINNAVMQKQSAENAVFKKNNGSNLDLKLNDLKQEKVKSPIFTLKSVNFSGNTIFKTQELNAFTNSMLGKEVTLEDVRQATLQMTALYRSKGYVTSLAYLPPQTIKDGVVDVVVLEGKVGDISIRGNRWAKDYSLRTAVFQSNGVKENKVFNISSLKKSMNDINGQPYLNGKVTLQKGQEQGKTDIVLNLKEKAPIGFDVNWGNQGRDLVGEQQAGLTLSDYNLTGYGDSLTVSNILASGTYGLLTSYAVPVSKWGTKLVMGYSFTDVNLKGDLERYNIEGISHGLNFGLLQPILRNDKYDVKADIGVDGRTSNTTIGGSDSLNKYEVRALRAGITGVSDDTKGRWIARQQVSVGLPLLGGHDSNSHDIGCSEFVKFNTNLIRVQSLPFETTGIVRSSLQLSNRSLLGVEQMQLGGAYSVRGFDEGVLLGDSGYNLSFELRHAIPYLPDAVSVPYWKDKALAIPVKNRVQVATFYDQGWARALNGSNGPNKNFLQSLGFGLRIGLTKYLAANLDFGIPLGDKKYDGQQDLRFHFSITSNILPLPFKAEKL